MRIYKVIYTTHQVVGPRYSWQPSAAAANKERARLKWEYKQPNRRDHLISASVVPVEFPTTKVGILGWLNAHATIGKGSQ